MTVLGRESRSRRFSRAYLDEFRRRSGILYVHNPWPNKIKAFNLPGLTSVMPMRDPFSRFFSILMHYEKYSLDDVRLASHEDRSRYDAVSQWELSRLLDLSRSDNPFSPLYGKDMSFPPLPLLNAYADVLRCNWPWARDEKRRYRLLKIAVPIDNLETFVSDFLTRAGFEPQGLPQELKGTNSGMVGSKFRALSEQDLTFATRRMFFNSPDYDLWNTVREAWE